MMKNGNHIPYTDLEISMKKQQTITAKVDNWVQQSHLHLWAFVLVGEAFLFMFEASNYIIKMPTGLQTNLAVFC
jgi:hypothetical protein